MDLADAGELELGEHLVHGRPSSAPDEGFVEREVAVHGGLVGEVGQGQRPAPRRRTAAGTRRRTCRGRRTRRRPGAAPRRRAGPRARLQAASSSASTRRRR